MKKMLVVALILASILLSIGTVMAQEQLDIKVGWNMVSVPTSQDGKTVSESFGDIEALYWWNPTTKSYEFLGDNDIVEDTKGYWLASSIERTIVFD